MFASSRTNDITRDRRFAELVKDPFPAIDANGSGRIGPELVSIADGKGVRGSRLLDSGTQSTKFTVNVLRGFENPGSLPDPNSDFRIAV